MRSYYFLFPSPFGRGWVRDMSAFIFSLFLIYSTIQNSFASEVLEQTETQVVVRNHPRTGKPYVSIVSPDRLNVDPFAGNRKSYLRPDYRMLDPKIKSGVIPYKGPYSDRKKVYIFAASLAAVGTMGGTAIIATAPAATGTAASGGAGAYLAGGAAVAAGSAAEYTIATQPNPKKDIYTQRSESKLKASAS